jgi:hypothetical protein
MMGLNVMFDPELNDTSPPAMICPWMLAVALPVNLTLHGVQKRTSTPAGKVVPAASEMPLLELQLGPPVTLGEFGRSAMRLNVHVGVEPLLVIDVDPVARMSPLLMIARFPFSATVGMVSKQVALTRTT